MLKNAGHYALLVLPVAAVGAVTVSLLVVAVPRPYAVARLRGGPTEGATVLSLRLEVFERLRDIEVPLAHRAVRVDAELGDSRRLEWTGSTDERGLVEVLMPVQGAPVRKSAHITVRTPGAAHPLVEGNAELTVVDFRSKGAHRGGFVDGNRDGEIDIRAAAARGAFAVPFSEDLFIWVRRAGVPVGGVSLSVKAEGADQSFPAGHLTDAGGFGRVSLSPREHAVPVTVRAEHDQKFGTLEFTLPVVPGAMRVTASGARLRVESPIERDVAYLSVVSDSHRVRGAIVPLRPDGRGGAWGEADISPPLPEGGLWGVVSSEMDTRSMARIGWPLHDTKTSTLAATTFDVPDRLLLDGSGAGFRREAQRQKRVRVVAAVFSICAMALTLALLGLRAHRARAELEATLRRAGEPDESRAVSRSGAASFWVVLVALLCVALGFAALALAALFRM